MTSSSANVRSADSGLMKSDHRFPWKWNLSDLEKVRKNGKNVFSCFSCGGGSSMGYKLAGFTVVGCCEIDPRMLEIYKANLHPRLPYQADVRDFVSMDLPEELYHLDILDGSPPCSVFSMAGDREDGWNKEKVFREGQAKQKLDDLFFHFIAIAKRLQPKVVIAENVSGLIKGNAKGYVNEIFKAFQEAGYVPQLFLLNSAFMGVPQRRERTVFVARRKDLNLPRLTLFFNEAPIHFGEVRSEKGGGEPEPGSQAYKLLQMRRPGDRCMGDINMRWKGKNTGFTVRIVPDSIVCYTLVAGTNMYRDFDASHFSTMDVVNVQTFPQDYDFGQESPQYVCGMSVPPVMMANIATEVYEQWLKD